jgi:electron transfer flavoprotein beta subunit
VASEVVLVSVGNDSVKETLRHGLALGAHRAILVLTEQACNPLKIAKILQAVVAREKPEVVLMGKQSIDGDNNQTPQMLAALNNWPQATFVSKLEFEGQCVTATREVDAGLETLSIQLPAVISTDLRLNQPRYASLPNIMKAKQKPLQVIALEDFGIIDKQVSDILSVKPPLQRSKGVLVQSVAELVDKLKQEAKVL